MAMVGRMNPVLAKKRCLLNSGKKLGLLEAKCFFSFVCRNDIGMVSNTPKECKNRISSRKSCSIPLPIVTDDFWCDRFWNGLPRF
jgi:hypothetical protein